jgi:hypothetical protein
MGTSKSPQRRSQHNRSTHLVIIIYIQCRLPIYTFWGYIIIKRNANMACWFHGKIRDYLHRHFYSFLEPLHIKKISEIFIKNLSINNQPLFTCRSGYNNFALHNRCRRQHSLLQCDQFKISPSFQ